MKTLWKLPYPSNSVPFSPEFIFDGSKVTFKFWFEIELDISSNQLNEDEHFKSDIFCFSEVKKFKFSHKDFCDSDQINSFEKVVEIENSSFLNGFLALRNRKREEDLFLKHFSIYFDDFGCYEIIALEFIPPTQYLNFDIVVD